MLPALRMPRPRFCRKPCPRRFCGRITSVLRRCHGPVPLFAPLRLGDGSFLQLLRPATLWCGSAIPPLRFGTTSSLRLCGWIPLNIPLLRIAFLWCAAAAAGPQLDAPSLRFENRWPCRITARCHWLRRHIGGLPPAWCAGVGVCYLSPRHAPLACYQDAVPLLRLGAGSKRLLNCSLLLAAPLLWHATRVTRRCWRSVCLITAPMRFDAALLGRCCGTL
jgi:hypothetical protein